MTTNAAAPKVMSLETAISRFVGPGDHVHLGYNEARPNGAVLGLVRHFVGTDPRLTISSGGLVSSQSSLVSEGLVQRVIASFVGDNYPSGGPNALFQEAIDSGRVTHEETTLWTLVARLAAGALGVPFLPVNSLAGSDLAAQAWVAAVPDPFGGGSTTVVAALNPDVTVVHGVASDPDGNVILSPPYGETSWGALGARRGVIATVEAVLDRDAIRRYQGLVKIPSHVVLAVCPLPLGAHPYGLYSPIPEVAGYVEDDDFILDQRAAAASPVAQRAWVDTWIRSTAGHAEYLDRLGAARIQALLGAAAAGAWALAPEAVDRTTPPAAEERMTLEAARVIEERILTDRFAVIMTGIGFANLAAWVAHKHLASRGRAVPLMAEIGAYGYEPRPGNPFIFSHRNLPTCTWMTDVGAILGSVVSGRHGRCLAVVGAGAIDQHGNVNSSRTAKQGFLVGSGGANDIASGATEIVVVVKHGRSRLVPEVPFVTCPGERVRTVVTTEAVLDRDPDHGRFVLRRLLCEPPESRAALERARAGCGWDLEVARELTFAEPVNDDELHLLRSFDPRGAFLPTPKASGELNPDDAAAPAAGAPLSLL